MNLFERFLRLDHRTRLTSRGPRPLALDYMDTTKKPNRSPKQKARDRARAKAAKQARKVNRVR